MKHTHSESIVNISKALLSAQKKIDSVKKTSSNPFFKSKYADLGSVIDAVKDILNSEGILAIQPIGKDEMGDYVETVLIHAESGEYLADRLHLIPATDMQKLGSAISYARRYGLQSFVLLPSEDDDGNSASGLTHKKEAPAPLTVAKSQLDHLMSLVSQIKDSTISTVVSSFIQTNKNDSAQLEKAEARIKAILEAQK